MATITSYAIEKIATGEIVKRYSSLPKSLDMPDGRRVISPVQVGDEGLGHRLIQIDEVDFSPPGQFLMQGDDVTERRDNVVTVTRSWLPWAQAEIDAWHVARREAIVRQIDDADDVVRAAVLVIMDELNRHSAKLDAVLAAAAGAGSLSSFKTAMGQVGSIPQRRGSDLRAAIFAKLGDPDAAGP
ncbi:MAG: hypothetical protein ABFD89_20545 [Bryobacteraceae bacterium]